MRDATDKNAASTDVATGATAAIAAKVLYLATRVLMPPVILSYLDLATYGVWSVAFVVVAYVATGNFGVTLTYVRYVAEFSLRGDLDAIDRLTSTGTTLLALLNLALLGVVGLSLPILLDWLGVEPSVRVAAERVIPAVAAIFLLDQVLSVYGGVLEGLNRIPATSASWAFASVVECIAIVVLLQAGLGIDALVYAFGLRSLVQASLNAWMCRRALPSLRIRLGRVDRDTAGLFFRFAGVSQVSGILGMLLRSSEKVLAGTFLGTATVGLYEIGGKLPVMAAWIPASIGAAAFPASARLAARGDRTALQSLYVRSARAMSLLTGILNGFLASFALPVLVAWIGPDDRFVPAATILSVFTLPYHLNVVTAAPSTLYRAIAQPARELFYPVVQFLLLGALAASVGLGGTASIAKVNLAVAGSMIGSALLYLHVANRRFGVSGRRFIEDVLAPGLVPYAVAALVARLLHTAMPDPTTTRADALWFVLSGGLLYVAAIGVLLATVLLRSEERDGIVARLRGLPFRWPARPAANVAG